MALMLEPGARFAGKYTIVEPLGGGVEGEVYLALENATGIERAVKLFFRERNKGNRAARASARLHHQLGDCPGIARYVTNEEVYFGGKAVHALVSEFVTGSPLDRFLRELPGGRLEPFAGLVLLRALVGVLEELHAHDVAHGDLHDENVLVERRGLTFDVQLIDVAGKRHGYGKRDDVVNAMRLFQHSIGGPRRYQTVAKPIRQALGSMRRERVLKRFPSAHRLADALDNLEWD